MKKLLKAAFRVFTTISIVKKIGIRHLKLDDPRRIQTSIVAVRDHCIT